MGTIREQIKPRKCNRRRRKQIQSTVGGRGSWWQTVMGTTLSTTRFCAYRSHPLTTIVTHDRSDPIRSNPASLHLVSPSALFIPSLPRSCFPPYTSSRVLIFLLILAYIFPPNPSTPLSGSYIRHLFYQVPILNAY